ncbi:unnamed protein product [Citrullus colocynthis]|uniref:Uncharacterized protein n=1 Tax=Citrullus colocynthis TaxID=252529 RepID=A0ABP0ZAJ9_9ROSI
MVVDFVFFNLGSSNKSVNSLTGTDTNKKNTSFIDHIGVDKNLEVMSDTFVSCNCGHGICAIDSVNTKKKNTSSIDDMKEDKNLEVISKVDKNLEVMSDTFVGYNYGHERCVIDWFCMCKMEGVKCCESRSCDCSNKSMNSLTGAHTKKKNTSSIETKDE